MKKIFLLLIIQCAYNVLNAQNVAINTSGATAVASAMLDITSTTSGVLIPRMTQAQRNAIGAPATGLLIYQTDNTPGFYFYNGVTWVPLFSTNTGWSITGNAGTVVGTNFLGTTDNVSLAINTNNLERMRVLNTGKVAVNSTTTFGVSTFYSLASGNNDAVDGNAAGTGDAVYGQNTGTGTGASGLSTNATGFALRGDNINATGTGIYTAGNGIGGSYLVNGSGIASNGLTIGVAGFATSTVAQAFGGYFINDGCYAYVGGWQSGPWTMRKIIGNGSVSTIVNDLDNNPVTMTCPESPEVLFQDFGKGQLINGKIKIDIDPIFANNIVVNENHPLRVFIQLNDNCNGVYVANETQFSFEVIELMNGNSNAKFTWFIVANRADEKIIRSDGTTRISHNADLRFPPAPKAMSSNEVFKREIKGR